MLYGDLIPFWDVIKEIYVSSVKYQGNYDGFLGKVTNFDGQAYSIYKPTIVATNKLIHNQLLDFIQNY